MRQLYITNDITCSRIESGTVFLEDDAVRPPSFSMETDICLTERETYACSAFVEQLPECYDACTCIRYSIFTPYNLDTIPPHSRHFAL